MIVYRFEVETLKYMKGQMEALRKILNSDELENGIQMPKYLKHRQVEILIFPVDEEAKSTTNKTEMFENLCGIWEERNDVSLDSIRIKAWMLS